MYVGLKGYKLADTDFVKAELAYQIGLVYHQQQQYDQAYTYYNQSVTLRSENNPLAHYGLGQILIHRNELDKAIEMFEKITSNASTTPENFGTVLVEVGKILAS